MPQITYVQHDKTEQRIVVDLGLSVMQGALWHRVPGILGLCCGDCGCATCHVYVDGHWKTKVGLPGDRERSTLRFAWKANDESRLACQIRVTDELDGLVVRVPERQY